MSLEDEDYVSYFGRYLEFFPGVVHRIITLLQLPTEIGDRYGFLVIVVIDLLYVIRGVILLTAVKKKQAEGVGSAEDQLHDVYLMLKHHLFNSFLSSG